MTPKKRPNNPQPPIELKQKKLSFFEKKLLEMMQNARLVILNGTCGLFNREHATFLLIVEVKSDRYYDSIG